MKKFTLILVLSLAWGITGYTQTATPSSPGGKPQRSWYQMMQDPYANFYETQLAFYQSLKDPKVKMGRGYYKTFKRWEYINQFRADRNGVLPLRSSELRQYQNYLSTHLTDGTKGSWSEVGPLTYPINATAPQPTGMGRINAIAFHPTDPNILYAGAPSGGIWKTVNGGQLWTYNSGNLPTIGVSAILINPNDPKIMYAGTGDIYGNDCAGTGIFKSIDGGSDWQAVNNGIPANTTVGMMIMHPLKDNIILAATSKGIYKTINRGTSWEGKKTDEYPFKDIKFKPGDPSVVYATAGGRFFLSTDTGNNWIEKILPITGERAVIGVSPNSPGTVYVCQTEGVFKGLMMSIKSGEEFKTQSTSPLITGYECLGTDAVQQSNYNLCMTVDPNNASKIYVGSINMWKSDNEGKNWAITAIWYPNTKDCKTVAVVHADQHYMAWSPVNGRLYVGNDGGIYWTSNGGSTWTETSVGLGISQIYRTGQSATVPSLSINGFQDNGTGTLNEGVYTTVVGGDGMDCFIDYSDTSYRWGSYSRGDLYRKGSNQHEYTKVASTNLVGLTDIGGWVTPFIQHVKTPTTVFMGRKNLWRSTNARVEYDSLIQWVKITNLDTITTGTVVEQSIADPNILYFGRKEQKKEPLKNAAKPDTLIRSDNVNDASPSWVKCALPGGLSPSSVKAHPRDPSIVYATTGSRVYKSTNKGVSWDDISGTLPENSINCVAYDTNTNEGLYIGTIYGVYYKNAGMSNWVPYSTNLPKVDIRDLKFYHDPSDPSKSLIKAATYGRGLWQAPLYSFGGANPTLRQVNFSAGSVTFNVVASDGINWTVSSDSPWCTVTGSGTGNGSFTANYTAQGVLQPRLATMTLTPNGSLNPKTVKLLQTFPQGVNDELSNMFSIYPNPTPGRFTVESQDKGVNIESVTITDLTGKLIRKVVFGNESKATIDLSAQSHGSYLVTIETKKGTITRMLEIAQ